jgi:hypothetical protein
VWPAGIRAAERSKKIGSVKEYHLRNSELRMEVYMDYVGLLPKVVRGDFFGYPTILCITTGRKCMIAATVSILYSDMVLVPGVVDNSLLAARKASMQLHSGQ